MESGTPEDLIRATRRNNQEDWYCVGCGYFQNKTNHTKLTIDIQGIILYYPLYNERQKMNRDKLAAMLEDKDILQKTDFAVSWYAKKYNKVIFRVGNMSKEGCRTWERW